MNSDFLVRFSGSLISFYFKRNKNCVELLLRERREKKGFSPFFMFFNSFCQECQIIITSPYVKKMKMTLSLMVAEKCDKHKNDFGVVVHVQF